MNADKKRIACFLPGREITHPSSPNAFGVGKDYPSPEGGWVWTPLSLYHNGGHKISSSLSYLRSSVFICG
jgi:hypothetical protein